jgi:hypothetical protein
MPLMKRLSRVFSRSENTDQQSTAAQADAIAQSQATTDAASSSAPPAYASQAPDFDAENVLDPPDITAGFANLTVGKNTNGFPNEKECIAHLKMLECFYRLRQKIGSSDGLFGINDSLVNDAGLPYDKIQTPQCLAKLAEKRWAIYVSRAVQRFEAWINSLLPGGQIHQLERSPDQR